MTYLTKFTSYILISFLIVASVFVGFGGGLHLAAAETANYGWQSAESVRHGGRHEF